MRRVRLWRDLGRPEARLIGAQYRANDDGKRQGPYTSSAGQRPWLFEGTGLPTARRSARRSAATGSRSTRTTPDSPPGTVVLAAVPTSSGPA